MLDNALTAVSAIGGGAMSPTSVSLVDTDDGRTIRSINLGGGNKIDLSISNAESTENKSVLSDRYLVRVDRTMVDDSPPYTPVKVSAYLVILAPRRPDVTAAIVRQTTEQMLSFFFKGTESDLSTELSIFDRLIAGEK